MAVKNHRKRMGKLYSRYKGHWGERFLWERELIWMARQMSHDIARIWAREKWAAGE